MWCGEIDGEPGSSLLCARSCHSRLAQWLSYRLSSTSPWSRAASLSVGGSALHFRKLLFVYVAAFQRVEFVAIKRNILPEPHRTRLARVTITRCDPGSLRMHALPEDCPTTITQGCLVNPRPSCGKIIIGAWPRKRGNERPSEGPTRQDLAIGTKGSIDALLECARSRHVPIPGVNHHPCALAERL